MNYPNSFAVSMVAWMAILINGLVIFRFKPSRYWKEILLISVFTSSISVVIQALNWIALITFVPPLLAFIFFTVLTRFNWIHTLTMIVVGVTVSGFLEFGVTGVLSHFDINLTLSKIAADYTAESWCFVGLHLLLSLFLYKKRFGFTSIQTYRKPNPNLTVLIFIFLFVFANSIIGIILIFKEWLTLSFVLVFFILFIAYMAVNYKNEMERDH